MPIFFNRYNSYLKFPLLNCITLVFSMFTRLYNHHQYVILSSVVEHLPTMHGAWVLSQAPQNKDKTNQTKLFSRTCLPSPKRPHSLWPSPSFPPAPAQTSQISLSPRTCLFCAFHTRAVTQWVVLGIWPHSLSTMFLRLTHIVARMRTSLLYDTWLFVTVHLDFTRGHESLVSPGQPPSGT
jgi:hypothetical protein